MNIPNIPDNLHKFLLLGGVLLLVYAYVEERELTDTYNYQVDKTNSTIDSMRFKIKRYEYRSNRFLKKVEQLSLQYGVENPLETQDSTIIFTRPFSGSANEVLVGDSVSKLWDKFNDDKFEIGLLNDERISLNKKIVLNAGEYLQKEEINGFLTGFAIVMLLFGLYRWNAQQKINDQLLQRQIYDKGKIYDNCQSCGRFFSAIRKRGRNKDKTENAAFCIECFDKGKFNKKFKLEEFEILKNQAIDNQKNWIKKLVLKNRLSKLERWKSSEY